MNSINTITITGSRKLSKKHIWKKFDEYLNLWTKCGRKWLVGGACGVDHWAIEWLLEKNEDCTAVVPFTILSQPKVVQPILKEMKKNGKVIELKLPNNKGAYLIRNKFMVDRSNVVIGFWNGRTGGSSKTLIYGIEKGREVHAYPIKLS